MYLPDKKPVKPTKKPRKPKVVLKPVAVTKVTAIRKPKAVKSKAWVGLEYKIADLLKEYGFKAYRVLRGKFESVDDVHIKECSHIKIDAKYRQGGWAHHKVFVEQVEQYRSDEADIVVMITKSGGLKNDELACMKLRDFASIIQKAYLNPFKGEGLCCPQCSKNTVNEGQVFKDIHKFSCLTCNFQFMTQEQQ